MHKKRLWEEEDLNTQSFSWLLVETNHCCCRIIVVIYCWTPFVLTFLLMQLRNTLRRKHGFDPSDERALRCTFHKQLLFAFFIPFVISVWLSFRINVMCNEHMIFPVENRTLRPIFYFNRLLAYIFPLHLRLSR